jgi:hypothetical protein
MKNPYNPGDGVLNVITGDNLYCSVGILCQSCFTD